MVGFAQTIINKAKKKDTVIVFPESTDERILRAVAKLYKEKIVTPVLVGDRKKTLLAAKKAKVKIPEAMILNPKENLEKTFYAEELFLRRQEKGMTLTEANKLVTGNPLYFAGMMVSTGAADGMVTGATSPTKETIQAALWCIGTKEKLASSMFFMEFSERTKSEQVLLFSDCGFNIKPTTEQLAQIALQTVDTAEQFGMTQRVAMLSFSTKGSAQHEDVTKVQEATKLVKKQAKKYPKMVVDGELQFDAAFVAGVQKSKAPKSSLGGKAANIFIFPDLNSGNIAYKVAQRLGNGNAYGPILQGLKKPVNDLSRGCDVDEIVVVAAITALQVEEYKN